MQATRFWQHFLAEGSFVLHLLLSVSEKSTSLSFLTLRLRLRSSELLRRHGYYCFQTLLLIDGGAMELSSCPVASPVDAVQRQLKDAHWNTDEVRRLHALNQEKHVKHRRVMIG
jgi:hypothetical protein